MPYPLPRVRGAHVSAPDQADGGGLLPAIGAAAQQVVVAIAGAATPDSALPHREGDSPLVRGSRSGSQRQFAQGKGRARARPGVAPRCRATRPGAAPCW